ncbi:lipopolysaccharide heptosyltransferase II [Sedimentisphaera cyanobacteriorum]|uniref:Lipopolysaccharide heptosyltransferase II n=1 Tax=Sedimentisphaera cyanobacteriorum TaxID=1940790 RepID=A0A1Q2HRF7_9BACT|nr:glycosyltransferase family 9 protein [Sedimentisphaera cyanobacteriorum]AQQ10049.1 lipopolysaccharide heptosyltransferase II [Sedimentisphaera cyanobacteriorum]
MAKFKVYDIFRALHIDKQAKALQDGLLDSLCRFKSKIYFSRLHLTALSNSQKPSRVLIAANISGIGNCIAATPLAQAVRIAMPNAEITFMASKGDLFDSWHIPDKIIKDKTPPAELSFDYTLIPYWGDKIHPSWLYEPRCGKVLAYKNACNKWFLKPEREYDLDIARRLGYKGGLLPEYVGIKPAELVPQGRKIITLLPCSKPDQRWEGKKWPKFHELINLITEELPDYTVCIAGLESDEIEAGFDKANVLDLRGRLSLAETAFLLKNSELAVANDSGPAHISDAAGTYTIWLFGMSCIVKNHPMNKYRILKSAEKCSPCQYTGEHENCPEPRCINSISAEKVLEEIKRFLNTNH